MDESGLVPLPSDRLFAPVIRSCSCDRLQEQCKLWLLAIVAWLDGFGWG
jgi:hypothetical protein